MENDVRPRLIYLFPGRWATPTGPTCTRTPCPRSCRSRRSPWRPRSTPPSSPASTATSPSAGRDGESSNDSETVFWLLVLHSFSLFPQEIILMRSSKEFSRLNPESCMTHGPPPPATGHARLLRSLGGHNLVVPHTRHSPLLRSLQLFQVRTGLGKLAFS